MESVYEVLDGDFRQLIDPAAPLRKRWTGAAFGEGPAILRPLDISSGQISRTIVSFATTNVRTRSQCSVTPADLPAAIPSIGKDGS